MITLETSNLSNNLTNLLAKHNLTISQLASEIEVTIATLSKLVNNKIDDPRATTLKQIAAYFKISIDELLGVSYSSNTALSDDMKNVPIYKIVQSNNSHELNQTTQYVSMKISGDVSDYFITYFDSPAMYPLFNAETMILFKKNSDAENKQFVLCEINSTKDIILRQIIIDGNTRLLKPMNSDFNIIQLLPEDKIIAVAVQIQRELIC